MGLDLDDLWIVTGPRGAGKSRFCQQQAAEARREGWRAAGLLSLALFEAGEKIGIQVENLRSGERRLLASKLPGKCHGVQLGPWTFDDQVLVWGNLVLQESTPCDLLVVDELGPLEFDQGVGWTAGFDVLDSRAYRQALVVVRPEYLSQARQRWPWAGVWNPEISLPVV